MHDHHRKHQLISRAMHQKLIPLFYFCVADVNLVVNQIKFRLNDNTMDKM